VCATARTLSLSFLS